MPPLWTHASKSWSGRGEGQRISGGASLPNLKTLTVAAAANLKFRAWKKRAWVDPTLPRETAEGERVLVRLWSSDWGWFVYLYVMLPNR